jgi:hypothetical protein
MNTADYTHLWWLRKGYVNLRSELLLFRWNFLWPYENDNEVRVSKKGQISVTNYENIGFFTRSKPR